MYVCVFVYHCRILRLNVRVCVCVSLQDSSIECTCVCLCITAGFFDEAGKSTHARHVRVAQISVCMCVGVHGLSRCLDETDRLEGRTCATCPCFSCFCVSVYVYTYVAGIYMGISLYCNPSVNGCEQHFIRLRYVCTCIRCLPALPMGARRMHPPNARNLKRKCLKIGHITHTHRRMTKAYQETLRSHHVDPLLIYIRIYYHTLYP